MAEREVSVAAGRLEGWLAGFAERHGDVRTTAGEDEVHLAGADGAQAWISVPFPPRQGNLVDHVGKPRRVGVLLVRRGGYAVGRFEGHDLTESKVGSTYVQGTTKAGGWSQHRYARRRANQADAAFAAAADATARVLDPRRLDTLVAGGDRPAVRAVLADPRLAELAALGPVGPWLQVKDPKLRVLAATPDQFLAVRIRLDP